MHPTELVHWPAVFSGNSRKAHVGAKAVRDMHGWSFMDIFETSYGTVSGIADRATYASGAIKSCRLTVENRLQSPVGELVPLYQMAELGERQKKDRRSLGFYESGKIKSVALDRAMPLKTPLGVFKAEAVRLLRKWGDQPPVSAERSVRRLLVGAKRGRVGGASRLRSVGGAVQRENHQPAFLPERGFEVFDALAGRADHDPVTGRAHAHPDRILAL